MTMSIENNHPKTETLAAVASSDLLGASKLKTAINALDRIACDWEHMKRADMVRIAGEALCEIGVWRRVTPGEFARHGIAYSPNDGGER